METSQVILFVASSLALIASPGPDMIYVLTRGVAGGKRVGLFSAIGVAVGILVHTVLASVGLAALFQTSPLIFMIIRYAGAAYLIFLGIQTFLSNTRGRDTSKEDAEGNSYHSVFWQGIVTNVLNPKVALFFLAFLPQFIQPNASSPALYMIMLGGSFALITLLLYGSLGFFAGNVGQSLKKHPRVERWMQRFSGLVLIGLGVRLVFMQQK